MSDSFRSFRLFQKWSKSRPNSNFFFTTLAHFLFIVMQSPRRPSVVAHLNSHLTIIVCHLILSYVILSHFTPSHFTLILCHFNSWSP